MNELQEITDKIESIEVELVTGTIDFIKDVLAKLPVSRLKEQYDAKMSRIGWLSQSQVLDGEHHEEEIKRLYEESEILDKLIEIKEML